MFLEDTITGMASYFGQDPALIAVVIGLVLLFVLFLTIAILVAKYAHQTLSVPMDVLLLGIGVSVVTFFEWWPSWVLIAIIIIAIFVIVFMPGSITASGGGGAVELGGARRIARGGGRAMSRAARAPSRYRTRTRQKRSAREYERGKR